MEDMTLLEYSQYSDEKEDYITIGVYVKKAFLKHQLGFKPNEENEFYEAVENISSEDVIDFIEKYGCYGIVIN